ncbi:exported hypothetical protein [uncultured Paludibacter sp.]|uniref:Uncharacterized protein n=1 Tax=uncultured Paludibacter sp. TaxID=497635 RepID=A0A653A6S6_9BACT|nr:exported hypothetical protein [uncultured Paludibacter sp.]
MKKRNLMYAVVTFIFLCSNLVLVNAQDNQNTKTQKKSSKFGSFLKKVGEATTGINMTDESFVVNPISTRFKVEFVDCIGNSAEQKFQVYLKITNKGTNESNMCVGGSCGGSSLAVDNEGNSYKPNKCAGDCKDFPTGIPVKVMVEFEKVLPSVKSLEVIKLNLKSYGVVELRNIPLKWDAALAENPITALSEIKQTSLTNSLTSKYDIELVNCAGDSAKQRIEITLKVKNKGTNEHICIGGSCSGNSMAVDSDGNSYKSESCAGDCVDLPTGINVKAVVGFNEVLPSVKMFDYMKLNVGNGFIEIRNLSVNWK